MLPGGLEANLGTLRPKFVVLTTSLASLRYIGAGLNRGGRTSRFIRKNRTAAKYLAGLEP